MTPEQIENVEANAKSMLQAKENLTISWSNLVTGLKQLGYTINPKTAKVSKIK